MAATCSSCQMGLEMFTQPVYQEEVSYHQPVYQEEVSHHKSSGCSSQQQCIYTAQGDMKCASKSIYKYFMPQTSTYHDEKR